MFGLPSSNMSWTNPGPDPWETLEGGHAGVGGGALRNKETRQNSGPILAGNQLTPLLVNLLDHMMVQTKNQEPKFLINKKKGLHLQQENLIKINKHLPPSGQDLKG